jgi:hypothetical protein
MGDDDDPSIAAEPAYGFFGVYHPCDQHPTAQQFPIFDLEEVRRIAAEIRPNTSRFVMKEHAKGARIRNDKEQLPEADQHREMFSWAIQSELIEVLGSDPYRAMALAYVLCAHYSTRAFVIVAPMIRNPRWEPLSRSNRDDAAPESQDAAEQREQFTRTWATETLEAMAGVPDDLPDLNRNLASLDNAALAEQAHAFITELTARLEHPPPAALMPNHELCFVAWEALNALAARGLLQIKIKQGRRYVPLNRGSLPSRPPATPSKFGSRPTHRRRNNHPQSRRALALPMK